MRLRDFYNVLSEIEYSLWEKAHSGYYFTNLIERVRNLIRKLMDTHDKQRVLDVGCGFGDYLILLHNKLSFGVGVDISSFKLRVAKKKVLSKGLRNKMDFAIADATKLPFRDDVFGGIICSHVVEHLINPQIAIKDMFRALERNGRFVCITPNGSCIAFNTRLKFLKLMLLTLGFIVDVLTLGFLHRNEEALHAFKRLNLEMKIAMKNFKLKSHLHEFRTAELEKMLVETGFRIESICFSGSHMLGLILYVNDGVGLFWTVSTTFIEALTNISLKKLLLTDQYFVTKKPARRAFRTLKYDTVSSESISLSSSLRTLPKRHGHFVSK